MGRTDTPNRDRVKPYQRSPRDATPQRDSPGLLKSVFSKFLSPFRKEPDLLGTPERIAKRLTGTQDEEDDDVFRSDEQNQTREKAIRPDEKAGPSQEKYDRVEDFEPPIAPIQRRLDSLKPISPADSTCLLKEFYDRKAAIGQGGQQSPEEELALKELLRRASTDVPSSPSFGSKLESRRHGRGLFTPIQSRGLVRSGSAADMHPSPSVIRAGGRQLTPLRQSVLTKRPDQTAPVSASPTITSFSSSLAQSMSTPNLSQIVRAQSAESAVRLSPVTGRPLAGKTPRHYAGPGMSSQPGVATPSRFGAAGGSRAGTPSWGPAQSTPASGGSSAATQVTKPTPPKRTEAASILMDLLQKQEENAKIKTPARPIINPYEGQEFNIGSSGQLSTPGTKSQSILKSRSRPSTLERAARRKAAEEAKTQVGDKRMSDFDLIQAGMGGDERRKKRTRIEDADEVGASPGPPQGQMAVDSASASPAPKATSAPEEPAVPTLPESYKPSERYIVPPLLATTPSTTTSFTFAPKPSGAPQPVSAFDVVQNTVAQSVPKRKEHAEATPPPSVTRSSSAAGKAHPFSFASSGSSAPFGAATTPSVPFSFGAAKPSSSTAVATSASNAMDKVAAVHVGTLPVYTFVALAHAPDVSIDGRGFAVDIKARVMRMDVKDLPTFSFLGQQLEDKSSNAEASGSKQSASAGSSALGGGDATPKNAPAAASTWKCDLCGLQSKGTDKCDICDAPKPKNAMAATSGSTSGFTGWGPSTAKPPPATPSDGAWKCDLCGLMSKAGSLKCDVCEAPKPGAAPAATTASTGFTGWGAGVTVKKPKVAEQAGAWTCGTCGCVSSPGSVKCDVCETPK